MLLLIFMSFPYNSAAASVQTVYSTVNTIAVDAVQADTELDYGNHTSVRSHRTAYLGVMRMTTTEWDMNREA